MAGALFDSKIIKQEMREKYTMILDLYQQEVQTITDIFEKNYKHFKKVGLQVRLIAVFVSFAVDDQIVSLVYAAINKYKFLLYFL